MQWQEGWHYLQLLTLITHISSKWTMTHIHQFLSMKRMLFNLKEHFASQIKVSQIEWLGMVLLISINNEWCFPVKIHYVATIIKSCSLWPQFICILILLFINIISSSVDSRYFVGAKGDWLHTKFGFKNNVAPDVHHHLFPNFPFKVRLPTCCLTDCNIPSFFY